MECNDEVVTGRSSRLSVSEKRFKRIGWRGRGGVEGEALLPTSGPKWNVLAWAWLGCPPKGAPG